MRTGEIEASAAKNKPIPKYMTIPEMCLYTSLRALYYSFRKGQIEREDARIEKSILISKCSEFEKEYLNWCSVYKAYQDNIRKAGSLLNEIEKSENLYDIAVNACETISIMTGDESFAESQKRKIHERRLK